ncbi:MAG TPA: sulfurtransferase [Burkholderiaceae bacterium]|nr:sulfurtransferase [Burkholderiaceae bacterium]
MSTTHLVDGAALAARLGDPQWRIVDCRFDLGDPGAGRRAYDAAHIPGAVHADLDHDLAGAKTGRNGRHPLPDPQRLVERLCEWGIGDSTRVVAYDAHGASFAARLWWLLRWLGHGSVAVLDGGWTAWVAEGRATDATAVSPPRASFSRRPPLERHVDAAEVERRRRDPAWLVLDARAPERYRGAVEPIDPVAGHIPGAVNRCWQANLADGRFKSAATLRREYEDLLRGRPADRVVASCGSGVTACHDLLALQVAGLGGGALYAGSWSEWCADPDRPVATGDS